jgi:hypothetical protein
VWHPYYSFTIGGAAPPPPPPVLAPAPRVGGTPFFLRRPLEYKDFPDEVRAVIEQVAEAQVQRLEGDEHKRFEELERELETRGIEWEARYLTALNEQRELLIEEEIGRLLRKKIKDEEAYIDLLLLALI